MSFSYLIYTLLGHYNCLFYIQNILLGNKSNYAEDSICRP